MKNLYLLFAYSGRIIVVPVNREYRHRYIVIWILVVDLVEAFCLGLCDVRLDHYHSIQAVQDPPVFENKILST